jgi:Protein of unknown function (DUF3574)
VRLGLFAVRSLGFLLAGFILLIAVAAEARAQAPTLSCHGEQKPKVVAELMFGRDIGDRIGVSERAWERFVAREITPRFPDGLTIIDASGQWRNPASGRLAREPSKLVTIVLPGNDDDEARLDAVVSAYKQQFHQRSVGLVVQPACTSF